MTTDIRWVRATTVNMVPPNEGRAIRIGAIDMALFNVQGDRFLAVDGTCPHQGGPLCDGIVAGDTVVCPLHAWKVNLVSGSVERPASVHVCVRTYPTQVVGDVVLIGVPMPDTARESAAQPAASSVAQAQPAGWSRRADDRASA